MNYVVVEWTDALFHEDVAVGEAPGPMHGEVVGHLLRDDEVCVTVALEAFEDGTHRRALAIPRGMVRRVRTLSVGGGT